jgi:signal transduction histidine kinase
MSKLKKIINYLLPFKSIQAQLFVFVVFLILIIISAISLTIYLNQKDILFNQAKDKAFSLTRILAYSSLNAILSDEYLILQKLIDSMYEGDDILSIKIIDKRGEIIAADEAKLRGTLLSDPLTQEAILSKSFFLQKESDTIWDTAVPIYKLEERIGTARIKFSVENTFSGLQESIIYIGLLALLFGLLLTFIMTKTYTHPIHKAIHLAEEYRQGNLDASIDLDRSDEVGRLIASLNSLSNDLKKVIEEKISIENLALIGEFSSFIMHDLKNPIAGILLLAEGIDENIPEEDKLKEYTKEIVISSKKIEGFLQSVLDLSRPQGLFLDKAQINSMVSNIIADFNRDFITLKAEFDQKIPEINVDKNLVERAVTNIIQNAVEAIDIDGIIIIKTFTSNNLVCISIEDNGIGIPKEKADNIFRPFYSEKDTGHGLGLAMVKRAVNLHQGNIVVESEAGSYTRFTISIPMNL